MSNAFGDLDGQFDSTGFNKGFSASSENRKFDTGYGPHFLEELDHDSFGSSLDSSNQQKQGYPPTPAVQRLTKQGPLHSSVPQYREPLQTPNHGLYSQVGHMRAGKKSYPTTQHKQPLSPYNVHPYAGHFTEAIPRGQVTLPVASAYGGVAAGNPLSRSAKYSSKSVQRSPSVREKTVTLKYFAEKYKPDDGFSFGADKFN
ncbi:hypothetical protein L798_14906 [Zootermopsis nevadensis]|uniref:Uncharacterized protein n=2 Tax=Zootermopsis nevadensis TaxID=136037 RepID=A0A067QNA5_ZOONE|nr:hypothetical protein L798_14906 [Zootermopsis nevadensis]